MKITICYVTSRKEPMFHWFVESLLWQYEGENVTDQIVIVDAFLEYETDRKEKLKNLIAGRFDYLHIPPKPSIWRGKSRKTKRDFYDGAGSKNTGIIVSETEYIVLVDDLCLLTKGWLDFHKKAASNNYILCGAYDKVSDIVLNLENKSYSYTAGNHDIRAGYQSTDTPIKSSGSWCFGSNTGFPLEFLKKVNGHDEFFARRGTEDCNLGKRLELAGYKDRMFYDKNCLIVEDEFLHYVVDSEMEDSYTVRKWKSCWHSKSYESKHQLCFESMEALEEHHLDFKKQYLPINKFFNCEQEMKLYLEKKQFRSVENDTFIDFDGEALCDL